MPLFYEMAKNFKKLQIDPLTSITFFLKFCCFFVGHLLLFTSVKNPFVQNFPVIKSFIRPLILLLYHLVCDEVCMSWSCRMLTGCSWPGSHQNHQTESTEAQTLGLEIVETWVDSWLDIGNILYWWLNLYRKNWLIVW